MNARDDEIKRVVAELDVHVAEVEADIAVLKALLADDEAPGDEDLACRLTSEADVRRSCPRCPACPRDSGRPPRHRRFSSKELGGGGWP